jgi:hypothetical protein
MDVHEVVGGLFGSVVRRAGKVNCLPGTVSGARRDIGTPTENPSRKLRALMVGTSLERIGDESLTRSDSGFVHGDI